MHCKASIVRALFDEQSRTITTNSSQGRFEQRGQMPARSAIKIALHTHDVRSPIGANHPSTISHFPHPALRIDRYEDQDSASALSWQAIAPPQTIQALSISLSE